MKLNIKGQVTIPAALRDKYGFAPGDQVEVVEVEGQLRIVHQGGLTRGERAVARVRGSAGAGLSTDEVMDLTRG